MKEKIDYYLEIMPLYQSLSKEIEEKFTGKRNMLYFSNGSIVGRQLYTLDYSNVKVKYPILLRKYKKEIVNKLRKLYSEYQCVIITEDEMDNQISLIVHIPCKSNQARITNLKKCQMRYEIARDMIQRLEDVKAVDRAL